ncbi:helix-turn-helix domain-containing protein [Mesorhizobium sp. WSM2239]|uniref:Helix-turn-helix domain-containing protein n=2 Tax=unclassified Mesorhizobium TaxID=325217 RepID=A0AAU8D6P8_9HYPH
MISEPFYTADLMLRAAAAALSMLMMVQFARFRPLRFVTAAGALFCLGIASYTLVSDPSPGVPGEALVLLAVLTPVFFWWFGIALFRDSFEWRHIYFVPLLLLLAFYGLRQGGGTYLVAGALLHQATVVLLLIHVFSLAVLDFRNDLVDARRRFRLTIALILPLVGMAIASVETYALYGTLPVWLGPLHALMLFALSFLFALSLTATKPELFALTAEAPQPRSDLLTSAELIELKRLKSAVGSGACFEPEMSLGALASKIAIPEHRLRRLIGKGLGYRNFAAFLNAHRIEEAKRRLADPVRSREQIVSIAFGVGYASLAPFNRAFRQLTGKTPSEYRSQKLSQMIDSGKD